LNAEDERGVLRTIAEYCRLLDDGDLVRLAGLFTPDGTFAFGRTSATGRDALVQWFEQNHPPPRRGKHITANSIVDGDDERATAVSDFLFVRRIDGNLTIEAAGRYVDVFVRSNGRWLIERRDAQLMR
jgi:hypothetical protein